MLEQFRSDAHVSAWKAHKSEAICIEALTLLWQGETHTAESLDAALPYRGHTVRDYENALKRLVKAGWVSVDEAGVYHINEAGRIVRQHIETQTDANFFAPFAALSDAERAELNTLLESLRTALTALLSG